SASLCSCQLTTLRLTHTLFPYTTLFRSPANLLIDVKGNLWITDFGLARLRNETGPTVSGDVVGTLRYMSPEQALGSPGAVDHRRSEEHTSELQSPDHLVCRLLLEKQKTI